MNKAEWTIEEFCDEHKACGYGKTSAMKKYANVQEAWQGIKPDWLVWVATRPHVLSYEQKLRTIFFCFDKVRPVLDAPVFNKVFKTGSLWCLLKFPTYKQHFQQALMLLDERQKLIEQQVQSSISLADFMRVYHHVLVRDTEDRNKENLFDHVNKRAEQVKKASTFLVELRYAENIAFSLKYFAETQEEVNMQGFVSAVDSFICFWRTDLFKEMTKSMADDEKPSKCPYIELATFWRAEIQPNFSRLTSTQEIEQ